MLVKLSKQTVLEYVNDDPVRPHISAEWRTENGREVYALYEDQYAQEAPVDFEGPRAIICVAYTNGVALTEEYMDELFENPNTAMFYTVWSYDRGAGREIVLQVAEHIKSTREDIGRFCTLSPLTEMAEKFHLRNGAKFLRRGETCQNFEYEVL
jgi:hypothetical protein